MKEMPALLTEHGFVPDIRSIALITSNAFSLVNFRGALIQAMVDAGLRVYALAPDFDDGLKDRLAEFGAIPVDISMDRTGMHPLRDLRDTFRLAKVLRGLRPSATLSYFIKPIIYGSLAARLAGVPRRFGLMAGLGYVFTPREGEAPIRSLLRRLVSLMYRAGFGVCERVFFHNADDLAYAESAGMLDGRKAVVLAGTGVDLTHFAAAPLPAAPLRFLMIARLLTEKGVREYAEAARRIRALHPHVEFHLVGPLDQGPSALSKDEVDAWNGVVVWHGLAQDVRPHIANCHVFVLPSYREGKPRSSQEALAMARALITTDAPGCRDTVDEGVNGFKVPIADVPALAGAMARFIAEPDLMLMMGRESRRIAEERFDIHSVNADILCVLGVKSEKLKRPFSKMVARSAVA
jgi:glycosyltransferase involved in cell wall biosynthesis